MSDYLEDLKINDLELDQEVIKQPVLFWKYSEMANEARQEYNDHKDFYASECARIEMEIRSGVIPIEGEVKMTEGSVKATIASNKELIDLKKEVNQKKREMDDFDSVVSAMDQRKHSLSNIVKLYGLGYNSEPYQNTNENVNERIKRTKGEN